MIDIVRNPAGYVNNSEVYNAMMGVVSLTKLVTGVCNNATYLIMMEAMRHLDGHPNYIGRTRRLFKDAVREWEHYEKSLLYGSKNRFFQVANMSPETRAKYGDITDKEYFEFWQGTGGTAYAKTKPLITSLANKFKLSFEKDGFKHADILQWPMVTCACMQMCIHLWERSTREACQDFKLDFDRFKKNVECLCIRKPYNSWRYALYTLEPLVKNDIEDKASMDNIELGIQQLYDAWTSPEGLYGVTAETIEDYDEIFAGKSVVKRAVREVTGLKKTIEDALERERREKLINTLKNK